MANYATLKAAIQSVITTNGNNEITGAILQQTLISLVDSLGADYQFVGIATPSTNPGTPDQNVFYIAGSGSYPNFNNTTVADGYMGVFKYNGSWTIETLQVGKNYDAEINQLALKVDGNFISSAIDGCKGFKGVHAGVNTMTNIATFDLRQGVKYKLKVSASSPTPSGSSYVNRIYKSDGTTQLMTANLNAGQTEKTSAEYTPSEDLIGCIFKSETRSEFTWIIEIAGFITEEKIANGAVTNGKIADGSISEGKIASNAVTEGKISDNAVTGGKIANNAVTGEKIANSSVAESKIADGAVSTQKIADNAVTIPKIPDYTKNPLLDGFYGGSNKNYNPYIKECYINDAYLATSSHIVTIRAYSTGVIIRCYSGNGGTAWTMSDYTIFSNYQNNDVIPITVTSSGGGAPVGTVVGYIIFNDIAGFKALANDTGNGQIFNMSLCTKLFTQFNIWRYIKGIGNDLADGAVTESKIADGAVSTQKIADGAVSLQKTTGVSTYEGVYISIPDNITAVVGDKIQIFFKSIVNCADISSFDVIAVCSKGKSYPRYWEYTPVAGDAGNTATITVRVRDNARNTIVEKSATISFVNKMTAPGTNKNVLCIGASATANGVWVGELKRRLTENTGDGTPANPTGLGLSNITFVGRKQGSSVNVPLEATGGWKVQNYASPGEPAFRMQVSGVTQLHIGDQYTSPNGGGVFVLQEINVTEGAGNLRFTFNSAVPTIPESGTLTRTSGTGDATIIYSSYEQENYSPFWNTATNKLDFAKYANDWCNGTIDVMIWHCGVNDIFDGSSASITSAVNAFKDILRQYHIDFPSGKVIISSVPTCSQNGGMAANYGSSSYANIFTFSNSARQYALALSELCADAEFSPFAFYSPVLEEFDAENNYPSTETPVNNRNTSITEKVGTNGVHPINAGSLQVADGVYRTFNAI